MGLRFSAWFAAALLALGSAHAQELTLKGAIDIHVHQAPDSVPRAADADTIARLARDMGMRGMVMKNHWEPTASLAYMVRKMVPGIEVFGGVTQDLAVGGINIEAVRHMAAITGGYGKVVWLPTFDVDSAEKRAKHLPAVPVSRGGMLLPNVLALLDYIATQPQLLLETGHITPQEGLLLIEAARTRGIRHLVVTHAVNMGWTVPEMKKAAGMGAYMEFVYHSTFGPHQEMTLASYAAMMKEVGPAHCILATDLGGVTAGIKYPLEPRGMLDFMKAMQRHGLSVAEIDRMAKTNPAEALGLGL
ncbi:MAG: hypothetical protein BGN85_02325 [Alphaproteobacteria bacterium 64-11]|nr:MAG: hypothetical protein BGN85_02325 [Alphaproteobacteria bacterium 64-11]